MSSQTSKYVIDFQKVLGSGATAQVYLGINVEDASLCAMKCSRVALKKEISIMRELHHDNIIKFYDSLSYFEHFTQVIVMEYCNRGSLLDFIDLHQGLCDNLFLKVLECLCRGIQYLRGKHLIHRDIKPGNMMVHLDPAGDFHVKLGDLGSAKEVKDGDTFPTMIGTPEYLHPDMYADHQGLACQAPYRCGVDLWSIGVTLYQAATTRLPFLPYQYSRQSSQSTETMTALYHRRAPGIISGVQNSPNPDDVSWSDQLPPDCRLSSALQGLASTLIGNLMNHSESFDPFFEEANRILQRKRTLMFNSATGELLLLYLDSLSHREVAEQACVATGVRKEEAVLLTRGGRLEPRADPLGVCLRPLPVRGHLRYALSEDTVLLVTSSPGLVSAAPGPPPGVAGPPSQEYPSVRDARKYSREVMRAVLLHGHSAEYADCQRACYQATVDAFTEHVLMGSLVLDHGALPWQMKAIQDSCSMTESLVAVCEKTLRVHETTSGTKESLERCKEDIAKLREKAAEGAKCSDQYHHKIVQRQEMITFNESTFSEVVGGGPDDDLDFLVDSAEHLVDEVGLLPEDVLGKGPDEGLLQIWRRLLRLFQFYEEANDKSEGKARGIKAVHESFCTWHKLAFSIMNRVLALRRFLQSQEERRLNLRTKFIQIEDFTMKAFQQMDLEAAALVSLNIGSSNVLKARIVELRELTKKVLAKVAEMRSPGS